MTNCFLGMILGIACGIVKFNMKLEMQLNYKQISPCAKGIKVAVTK